MLFLAVFAERFGSCITSLVSHRNETKSLSDVTWSCGRSRWRSPALGARSALCSKCHVVEVEGGSTMFSRVATLALGLALVTACADQSPVEPVDEAQFAKTSAARAQLFNEIPVTGVVPGGTFAGTLTINHLELGENRELLA